jgi:SAM-dependent methyltransferase
VDQAHRGHTTISYAILSCYCGRWPLVAGIPILRTDISSPRDELVAWIEAGRYEDALRFALLNRRPRGTPDSKSRSNQPTEAAGLTHVTDPRNEVTARAFISAYFSDNKDNSDYFFYRFAQPRLLEAQSIVSIVRHPTQPLLDLACGCGHLTHALLSRAEGVPVFGIDSSFFGAYVAKHWIAPEAEFICSEADKALPFSDNTFAAVFCSDAFHYFSTKATCIQECERLTKDSGLFALIWVHNARVPRPHDGLPLPVEGYQALVGRTPHRLLSNQRLLSRYLQGRGPDLTESTEADHLADEPTFSIVASHREEIFKDYGSFEHWPHAHGVLSINPIYVPEQQDSSGAISLRRTFPSAFFESDHSEIKEYLPLRVEVSQALMNDLVLGNRTREIEKLIETCVVVGVPPFYS